MSASETFLQSDIAPEAMATAKARFHEEGWCVLADVLSPDACAHTLERLWAAAALRESQGISSHVAGLDPNASNVRVFNLLDMDQLFRDLIRHPTAVDLVREACGAHWSISNFTANIARPGAQSMDLHSDQALVVPEPWLEPWAVNIIWCLSDVTFENGATLYIPGSHKVTRRAELGDDAAARLVPFEAKAGSIIAMEGRLWHTSGCNITEDEDRALMFGYYTRDFIRPQWNWNVGLSPETQAGLDNDFRKRLGLGLVANLRGGDDLLADDSAAKSD